MALISEPPRGGRDRLAQFARDKIRNLSTAADVRFHPIQLDDVTKRENSPTLCPFTSIRDVHGGIDHRKNIEGLIDGYALLPDEIRRNHQLAIVCAAQAEPISAIKQHARKQGLGEDELVLTGFVSDEDLVVLYNICLGFCFPSFHEGFGLPALEAMQCGAATIGSNTSNIRKSSGAPTLLSIPHNKIDIAKAAAPAFDPCKLPDEFGNHGIQKAQNFSWQESARRGLGFIRGTT